VLESLDAVAVRRWYRQGLEALGYAREEIDALNVYPVPDGDTGTNMFLTMESAVEAATQGSGTRGTAQQMARGALLGARGNSGVILSQLLRGVAEVLAAAPAPARGTEFADALERAVTLAYASVGDPVEGTMLTVARAAAEAARAKVDAGVVDLPSVVTASAEAAREALDRTPEQLDVLARAGVVDAGGRGVTVLLDSLVEVITEQAAPAQRLRGAGSADRAVTGSAREPVTMTGPAFEVMYLLEADDDAVVKLRSTLATLGDSLAVSGGAGLWNVHVHVDDPGAAVEAGCEAGRAFQIRVTQLSAADPHDAYGRPAPSGRALVAVAPGEGLAELFAEAGATVVLAQPGRQPSTADLLGGVRRAATSEAVLLVGDSRARAVAEAAAAQARSDGVEVAVVPTRASVQVLAALAVHDPARNFSDDVIAMTAAAGATRWGAVTVATRSSSTAAGRCRPGDVLGLLEDEVVIVGADLSQVAGALLDRMLDGGGELVTLVTGAQAPRDLADALVRRVRLSRPGAEVAVYEGGQPDYPLLVGVE
jgi:DAK2 domain fusion protein YloV